MSLYLIVLFFVMFWIVLEKISLNRKAIFVPYLFLVLFASFRDYTVGTDSENYTRPFRLNLSADNFIFNPNIEYGYQALVYSILKLGLNSYHFLFFLTTSIYLFCILFTLKKYSHNYILSVYVFVTFGFYTFFFNILRQGLAIAICFAGIKFLIEKNFFKYFLVVAFASLFHISAWIMLLLYFIVHIKVDLKYKVLFLLFISYIVSSVFINYLAESNIRYEAYTEESDKSGGYFSTIFYMLIAAFIYIYRKFLDNDKEFSIIEQIYFCGLAFMLPLLLLGTDPSGPQRIIYYFSFYLMLIIPYILNKLNLIFSFVFIFLSLIYFYLITIKLFGIYPYKIASNFIIF